MDATIHTARYMRICRQVIYTSLPEGNTDMKWGRRRIAGIRPPKSLTLPPSHSLSYIKMPCGKATRAPRICQKNERESKGAVRCRLGSGCSLAKVGRYEGATSCLCGVWITELYVVIGTLCMQQDRGHLARYLSIIRTKVGTLFLISQLGFRCVSVAW